MKQTVVTLALMAALVGCTSPVTPPTSQATAPIVALTVHGIGSQITGSSVRPVTTAQNALVPQEVSGLTFTPTTVQSFTATVGGQNMRYIHAAFAVGNISTSPLAFVPVSLADDAAVAGTGSPLTLGITAYSAVKLFDGSSAPALAPALILSQPWTFNAANGGVFPLMGGELSEEKTCTFNIADVNVPAGTVASFPSGSVTGGSYTGQGFELQGSGAVQPLNLGVTFDRTANPGNEPFSFTVLLAAVQPSCASNVAATSLQGSK